MNILFIASWYPNRIQERDGNFIQKHARCIALKHAIWVIHVVEDLSLKPYALELEQKNTEFSAEVTVYFGRNKHFPGLSKALNRVRAWIKAYKNIMVQGIEFDIVHVHVILYGGFFALMLKLWKNIPFVITEHSTIYQPGESLSYGNKILSRIVCRYASAILPVSINLENRMKQLGIRGYYEVIPNVVNTHLFNLHSTKKKRKRIFQFLHISNFSTRKNISGMLNAIQQLSKIRQDFRFTLAGDGPLQSVKEAAKRNGVEPLLHFQGDMEEKEVASLMKQHDAFILFSDMENLPCVLIEAQACGLPIITSEVGGTKEIVESSQLGILIPRRDEESLAHAMFFLIDNYQNFKPEQLHERASLLYGEVMVSQRFDELYTRVLKGKMK